MITAVTSRPQHKVHKKEKDSNRSGKSKAIKVRQSCKPKKNLQSIYWDVDDVILNTSEVLIDIINKKYRIPNNLPPKSLSDIKDYALESVYKDITPEQLREIFKSKEFWDNVTIKEGFIELYILSGLYKNYNNYLVSKGTHGNLLAKISYLREKLPHSFISSHIVFKGLYENESKSSIDMSGGIQIDDNIENLIDTNAKIKILLTNGLSTMYNNSIDCHDKTLIIMDDLYYANNLNEVYQILDFNLEHRL